MLKNETGYAVDADAIAQGGTPIRLASDGPQILIIHTHSSEAYTPAGLDRYEESDNTRTEDLEHNIIRVGDELTRLLEKAGLRVIHDRGVYDYPSYTGSYARSGAAVEQYLRDYPSISVVLDVHRDALGTDEVIYKTVAEENGTCASQAMLLVGTDESGHSRSRCGPRRRGARRRRSPRGRASEHAAGGARGDPSLCRGRRSGAARAGGMSTYSANNPLYKKEASCYIENKIKHDQNHHYKGEKHL